MQGIHGLACGRTLSTFLAALTRTLLTDESPLDLSVTPRTYGSPVLWKISCIQATLSCPYSCFSCALDQHCQLLSLLKAHSVEDSPRSSSLPLQGLLSTLLSHFVGRLLKWYLSFRFAPRSSTSLPISFLVSPFLQSGTSLHLLSWAGNLWVRCT